MMFLDRRGRMAAGAALCVLAASAACSDGGKSPTQPGAGSLEVVVNGSGTDIDPRFSIQVDAGPEETYSMGQPFVREGLAAGTYTVRISGISSNCTLEGANSVQVSVAGGQRARASFTLACAMRWLAFAELRPGEGGLGITRMNRDGSNRLVLTHGSMRDLHPAVSPDGRRIAFSSARTGRSEIYVMNADGSNPVRLTNLPETVQASPAWSPDGTRIAFVSDGGGTSTLRIVNADGSGMTSAKSGLSGLRPPLRWSPDGTRLAFTLYTPQGGGGTDQDLYTVELANGTLRRVTSNPGADGDPAWTADGRLVYATFAEGRRSVAIINADGSGGAPLYDNPAHQEAEPTVSSDGTWLVYSALVASEGWQQLWIVPVTGGTPERMTRVAGNVVHPSWQP